jgi:hypothetical protein
MANKNSLYIGALTSFILDTKPYHAKLTEVQEIYQFADNMTVNIRENSFHEITAKANWTYSYFSGGISEISPGVGQPMLFHELVNPLVRGYTVNDDPSNTLGAFKAFRDENTDLPLVPFAFDPKSYDGAGLSDAFVSRVGFYQANEPLLEGHDFYLSQGAYTFQIKQTTSSHPIVVGRFVHEYTAADAPFPKNVTLPFTNADSLTIITPQGNAQQQSLDTLRITGPGFVTVFGLSGTPNYQPLFSSRVNDGVLSAAIIGAQSTDLTLSTNLARGVFTDYSTSGSVGAEANVRENGELAYDSLFQDVLQITNIKASPFTTNYEEYTLEASSENTLIIYGSSSEIIGSVTVGDSYNSLSLAFVTSFVNPSDVLTIGTKYVLTPSAKITVHHDAPLEAWSIINVHPRAYTRPVFNTIRYGFIQSQDYIKGHITIIDPTLPSGTLILTCIDPLHFQLSSTAEPSYSAIVNVSELFNDGRVSFTIIPGTDYTFTTHDKFFIEILNEPAMADGLDIYFGYDTEPYDEDIAVYNTINSSLPNFQQKLGFGYDSRFVGYDLNSLGLELSDTVIHGRQWRIRALPDYTQPLNLHNAQGAIPINQVNEIASNDPLNPDAVAQYDMPNDVTSEGITSSNDPDTLPDVKLWYANKFDVQYLSGNTWVSIGEASVGVPFNSVPHGLAFTIQQTSKPYIASEIISSSYTDEANPYSTEAVYGGDVIVFTVKNSAPVQTEFAGLTSRRIPRLVMYGSGFYKSTAAKWSVTFTDENTYVLQGIHSSGDLNGSTIFPGNGLVIDTNAVGNSYLNSDHHLHFTVFKGQNGLANDDSFTFVTFDEQPTFLVHGSVSGWQADASVDEWYWNGKIGFKIKSPKVRLFSSDTLYDIGNSWSTSSGTILLNNIRVDAPSMIYTAKSHVNGHWMLYRDGKLISDGDTNLVDEFINITMPTAVSGAIWNFEVQGSQFQMAEGNDLAIIRTTPGRSPTNADFVLLERTRADSIQIAIHPKDTAHTISLQPLAPAVTDLRLVDHNANSGVPLSATSPETAVLSGWLGTVSEFYDKGTSPAVFRDTATSVVVRAASTGETIGTVQNIADVSSETKTIFRWDPAFHNKYLPLNAQATIVSAGSGTHEKVNVKICDNVFLLVSGGILTENALFQDSVDIDILESQQMNILQNYLETANTTITDTGFTGFLPGYDNTAFDFELGTGNVQNESDASGSYDAGIPLTEWFLQAQSLALLPSMTPAQQNLYNDLLDRISPWLTEDILSTTISEFTNNISANPVYNFSADYISTLNGFGIPDVGLGIEINTTNTASVGTSINESLSILSESSSYSLNENGFGISGLDLYSPSTTYLFSSIPAPIDTVPTVIPVSSIIPGKTYRIISIGTTNFTSIGAATNTVLEMFTATSVGVGTGTVMIDYDSYETSLKVNSIGAESIQLTFGMSIATAPNIYIWRIGTMYPEPVTVLQRKDSRTFTFSVPSPGEMKVIVN